VARQQPARIGLLGGESTGKSTLAADLTDALDACIVHEELRDFVARHGRTPQRDEQAGILQAQTAREEAAAAACRRPVLVADPAPVMTAVYSLLYFDDSGLMKPAVEHCRRYGLLVWCAADLPWTPDSGQRDGPSLRAAADDIISRLVQGEFEPRGIRVLRVSGDRAARVTAVRRAWQPSPPQGPT
jgi:nicotinamide riboside kinase